MDLPSDVIFGLKYFGDNNLTQSNFKRIVDSVVQLLLEEELIERVSKICPEKREVVEQAYAALLALVVRAAQIAADEGAVAEVLTGCGLKEDRIRIITNSLVENQQEIALKLSRINALPPSIVDVSWKLDYVIKTSNRSHVGEAQFLIVLTTEKAGKVDYLRFVCDQYQLQDLATKLKEIVHQVEKFASK